MYAVIRAGGKQYRVAPGDVIRVETMAGATDGKINFGDVLAISGEQGQIARAQADGHIENCFRNFLNSAFAAMAPAAEVGQCGRKVWPQDMGADLGGDFLLRDAAALP